MEQLTFDKINPYYLEIMRKYGVRAEIEIVHGDAPKEEIVDRDGCSVIRLNVDKVKEYEDYLAYNVRKLVLPCLTLESERLLIRRFQEQDGIDTFEFSHDRECCCMDGGYEPSAEMDEAYQEQTRSMAEDKSFYSIVRKDTGKAIGGIHLMPCENRAVECNEIGYYMNPSQQRQGYAYEALSVFLDYLLHDLHLDMVVAGVIPINIPSLGLLKKLGFTYEGNVHKGFHHPLLGKIDLLSFYKER